jgi:hypothetical protein
MKTQFKQTIYFNEIIVVLQLFLFAVIAITLSSPPRARFFAENGIAFEHDDSAARLPLEEADYNNQRFRRATVDSRHHAAGI